MNYIYIMFNFSQKIAISATLLASIWLIAGISSVRAASITLSPPKYEFSVEKGDTVAQAITITNGEESELILEVSKADFAAEGEAGKARFYEGDDVASAFSVSSWMTIPTEPVVVPPLGRVTVPFSITVPADAESGGHFGTVFFSPVVEKNGDVTIKQKVGTLVLVRVAGQIEESASLTIFDTYTGDTADTSFTESNTRSLYSSFPVAFAVRIENTGNVHLKPQGSIVLKNMFGTPIARVGEELVLNSAGAVTGTKLVDYIPVNDGNGNVLPNSSRVFVKKWYGYGSPVVDSEGARSIEWNGFGFGRYTAELDLSYGSTRLPVQMIHFWIIPWPIILPSLFGLIALIVVIRLLKKRGRERLKRELREELEQEQEHNTTDEEIV